MAPCPRTPNCVSSRASGPPHAIAPLPDIGSATLDMIEQFLDTHYTSNVVSRDGNYLYVVVTTRMGFKDDLEFLAIPDSGHIALRSASRIGYSDLGVNRARIEAVRQHLENQR